MVLAGLDRAGATPARAVRPRKPKAETIPAPAPSSRVVPGPARPEPKPKTKPSQEPKTEPPLDDLEVARARKVVEDYAAANDGRKIPRDEFKAELRVGSAKARRLLDAIEKEVAA